MNSNKISHIKEAHNFIKHIYVNNVGFSIMQIKTRRTQELVVMRNLTNEERNKITDPRISGIHVTSCYNVRDCLKAIKLEAKTNKKINSFIKLNLKDK